MPKRGQQDGIIPALQLEPLGLLRLSYECKWSGRDSRHRRTSRSIISLSTAGAWYQYTGATPTPWVNPSGIDLVHPVVDLPHRVVGITGAGPVAERHGSGDAGLAGQDLSAVLGGEMAQVEQVALEPVAGFDDLRAS